MKTSIDLILTTHVGSLARPSELLNLLWARERGELKDPIEFEAQIRAAVEELFKVKVVRVNTLNVHGKKRRQRTKQAGRAANWKKAMVKLKSGDKIELT